MILLYMDTSAIVKLYAVEVGSAEARQALLECGSAATSEIAYAECRAALAAKYRLRQFDFAGFVQSKADFEADWRRFDKLAVDSPTIQRAADFAEEFALRGYDALHLASVDRLRAQTRSDIELLCFDYALNRAAIRLGLAVVVAQPD